MQIEYERAVNPQALVVSPRPVWKCRCCPEYGVRPSCPPAVPGWKAAREWVRCYTRALLVKFRLEDAQDGEGADSYDAQKRDCLHWLLEKERALFCEHMYALALFPGNCNLCSTCACVAGDACTDPTRVRPSVDGIGIELDALVTLDFSEPVLYGLVLIE